MGEFTIEHAKALRLRLELGESQIDEAGREVLVPARRQRAAATVAARFGVPSDQQLLQRYQREGVDEEPDAPGAYEARLEAIVGKGRELLRGAATRAGESIDLAWFAAQARMPLEEILAMPDDRRRPSVVVPRLSIALHGSQVPQRYRDVLEAAGGLRDTAPLRDVRAWRKSGTWGIVLGGAKGVGKSVAACWALADAGGGLFVLAEELAAPDGRELVEQAEQAPLLVIDEMGEEALTDIGKVRLRTLFRVRHAEKRPTVMTCNLSAAAWGAADRYGERAVDWLREGGGFREYGGASLRGAK